MRSLTSALKRLTSSFWSAAVRSESTMSLLILLVLELVDDDFERLVVFAFALLHAEDDVAIHLDEAAVAVPGEALVLGGRRRARARSGR